MLRRFIEKIKDKDKERKEVLTKVAKKYRKVSEGQSKE
jgi:hypothetical protein